MVHGDLDPGNVIWVLDEQDAVEQIRKISSTLSQADLLTPYPIRMIDAGKDSGDAKKKAMARDSWNVYAETKEPIHRFKQFLSLAASFLYSIHFLPCLCRRGEVLPFCYHLLTIE